MNVLSPTRPKTLKGNSEKMRPTRSEAEEAVKTLLKWAGDDPAHVGYIPTDRVVGISKLARIVDAYAKRLQVQEKMNAQIANTLYEVLKPQGVAVVLEGEHHCMSTRGVHKPGVSMVTSTMLGEFRENHATRKEFMNIIGNPTNRIK